MRGDYTLQMKFRKKTTEFVFDFDPLAGTLLGDVLGREYNRKCKAFSSLVYYVHIIGDHLARKSYKVDDIFIPMGMAHPSDINRDVYYELQYHLGILFEDQSNSHKFMFFFRELETLAEEARHLAASSGGINTDDEFGAYHNNAEKLMELLYEYVPKMLKEEPFFNKVFSTE